MPLDDETGPVSGLRRATEGLRGLAATALSTVLVEAHLWIVAGTATVSLPRGCKMTFSPAQAAFSGRG
jgi:hypothetical protein